MVRALGIPAAIAALSMLPPSTLEAQGLCAQCHLPPGCRGKGNHKKLDKPQCQPLQLTIEQAIDFGKVIVIGNGIGQVQLDPASGMTTVTGNLRDMGGWSFHGRALVTGAPGQAFVVDMPRMITMSNATGGTSQVVNFTTDLGNALLDSNGRREFNFAGTLSTNSSVITGGTFRGQLLISVSYP